MQGKNGNSEKLLLCGETNHGKGCSVCGNNAASQRER